VGFARSIRGNRRLRPIRALSVALLGASVIVFSACDQFTGMGWMQSASCPHAPFPVPPAGTTVDELIENGIITFPPPAPVDPNCDARATFGFVVEPTSDTDVGRFSGSYSDPQFNGVLGIGSVQGVRLRGAGVIEARTLGSPSPRTERCIVGELRYESTDPNVKGSGMLQLLACDIDEPGADEDGLYINVLSGPYAGYTNFGFVQGGNLQ
jgi:hypothetical protein